MKQVVGVILAGGKSSRMGQDKSAVIFDGKSLLQNMTTILSQTHVSKVVINCNIAIDEQTNPPFIYIKDIISNKGPLSGIHTALVNFPDAHLLIVPVDIPLMTSRSLNALILTGQSHERNCRFAPFSVDDEANTPQASNLPLFIYNDCQSLRVVEQTLLQGQHYSVFNFCKQFPLFEVPIGSDIELTNVNYPWQLKA